MKYVVVKARLEDKWRESLIGECEQPDAACSLAREMNQLAEPIPEHPEFYYVCPLYGRLGFWKDETCMVRRRED